MAGADSPGDPVCLTSIIDPSLREPRDFTIRLITMLEIVKLTSGVGLGVNVSGVDLSPKMIEHPRRLHSGLRFEVASATDLALEAGSLGGILGWWSLFNLPREVLPEVLASFARALVPGGHALIGTHVGTGDVPRTEAYGGVPVTWTTHLWQPEQLGDLIVAAGLEPTAQLHLPASGQSRSQVLISARRAPATASHLT